jgi:hypothetical protein
MKIAADHAHPRSRGCALWLGIATLAVMACASIAAAACDTESIRLQAQASFSDYRVQSVRAAHGIVTLVLARPDGAPRFGVAVRTEGTRFYTSVMGAQLDADALSERARVSKVVGDWYTNTALQQLFQPCSEAGVPAGDPAEAVRDAAANVLSPRLGDALESSLVVATLLISLGLVLAPAWSARRSRRAAPARRRMHRFDVGIVVLLSLIALAIALSIAWRLAPENDEVVTLGARQETLASLLSWTVGGEPFNPPGSPFVFGVWLRLADGFFWARILPMLLIPITALVAYRAGTAAFGRAAGIAFTALVVLAPAYLRSAALARPYALIVLALCALLAATAGTYARPSRGAAVGVASVLAIWTSYLLWPLAVAAPWLARLALRDRLRLTTASILMAAVILPRISNGFVEGMTHTATFELKGPFDTLGYALARAGQAPPRVYAPEGLLTWVAGGLVLTLIAAAWLLTRQRARQLYNFAVVLVLVGVPIAMLLSGGRGIRERHVITLQVVLALGAAAGLAALLSAGKSAPQRRLGALAALALIGLSIAGNRALLAQPDEWLRGVGRMTRGAELVMVVPRNTQLPVTAMLTGNSAAAGASVAWPPVCESDSESWCHRLDDGRRIVAVDDVSDAVVDAAAGVGRSVWVFDGREPAVKRGLPARLAACKRLRADLFWTVLECAGGDLQRGDHSA